MNRDFTQFQSTVLDEYNKGLFTHVITHKSVRSRLARLEKGPAIGGHFGGIAGLDRLKGEAIGVFGTPYRSWMDIVMIAHALGRTVTLDDIRYDWYEIIQEEFCFRAYLCSPKKEIQDIEVGLIQGELSQAVGRSRILHHEVDVHLYSLFPVPGALLNTEVSGAEGTEHLADEDSPDDAMVGAEGDDALNLDDEIDRDMAVVEEEEAVLTGVA